MGKAVYVSLQKMLDPSSEVFCINPPVELIRALKELNIRINGFELKAGRNPGFGYLLMQKSDLANLVDVEGLTLKISDGIETVEIDRLTILDTWANHPKLTEQSLILVKISDLRTMALHLPTRLSTPLFPTHASISGGFTPVTTWAQGIEGYWNASNIRLSYSGVNTTQVDFPTVILRDVHYDVSGLDREDSDWHKLNDILDLCCHQVYKDYSGFSIKAVKNYSLVNQSLDLSIDNLAVEKRRDLTLDKVERPYSIRHQYRKISKDYSYEEYRNDPYIITNNITSSLYYTGTSRTVPVYNIYIPSDVNAATYLTDLQNLSQKLSQLYYDAYDSHEILDAEYFGVHRFEPGGDAVSIEFYHDEVGYVTKVRSIDMGEWVFPSIPRVHYQHKKYYMIQAPAGGIPARYMNKLGKATCSIVQQNQDAVPFTTDDDYIFVPVTPSTITVYNWTLAAVCANGSRYGIAGWVNDNYYVIAEDCGDDGGVVAPLSISTTFGDYISPIDVVSGGLSTTQSFSYIGAGTGTGTGGI